MDYVLYEHTLFHDCERCLREVAFYYTKLKYEKKVLSNLKGIQRGLENVCNESL